MKKIEINRFGEVEKFEEKLKQEKDFIIDLNNCDIKERIRIIDFFCGVAFLNGKIKKLSPNQFEVILNKEN